jgi:hypothetical protein
MKISPSSQDLVKDTGGGCNPRVFQLGAVVDTPLRARASIGKAVDDDVAFIGELLRRSYTEPATAVKGRGLWDNAAYRLPSIFDLGYESF